MSAYRMYSSDERDYRLPSTDISLQEACHRMRCFHVFEDLEEDDFLLIREGKWESRNNLLYELGIERYLWRESLARGLEGEFPLDSHHLESE